MSKLTVYRHDAREFDPGDVMPPAGDHYHRLQPDERLAEDAVRAGKTDGVRIRAECLYVYPDFAMAEFDWRLKKDRHLYELQIDDADIWHKGDLQAFRATVAVIRSNGNVDEAVAEYWKIADTSRHTEFLVSKAVVACRLKHSSEHRSSMANAIEKLRDDPEFDAFLDQFTATSDSRGEPDKQ